MNNVKKILLKSHYTFFFIIFLFSVLTIWPYYYLKKHQTFSLTVLHTDALFAKIHPEIDKSSGNGNEFIGGMPYLATQIKRIKNKITTTENNVLLLDAGSSFFGHSGISPFTDGREMIELMNALNYDAMTVGNKDLEFGTEVFLNRAQEANFPMLAANIIDLETHTWPKFIYPYIIKNYDDINVAIVGLTAPEMQSIVANKNISSWGFSDYINSFQETLKILELKKVDIIIVLSHLYQIERDKLLATSFSDKIDLIITRSRSSEPLQVPINVKGVPIVYTTREGKSLGRIDIEYDLFENKIKELKWKLYPIRSSIIYPDPKIQGIVDEYEKMAQGLMGKNIGTSKIDLYFENKKESTIASYICDLILEKNNVDLVVINSDNFRSIERGEITQYDLITAIPYNNNIVIIELLGQEIINIFKRSFDLANLQGILQESGLNIKYKKNMDESLEFVSATFKNGEPIKLDKKYIVATTTFLQEGGDGYEEFIHAPIKGHSFKLRNIVFDHLIDVKIIDKYPVNRFQLIK